MARRALFLVSATAAFLFALSANAQGATWVGTASGYCPGTYFCTYWSTLYGAVNLSTKGLSDWTFTDDPVYSGAPNNDTHNDHVKYAENQFLTGKIKLYQNAGFGTPGWCLARSAHTNALPWDTAAGASSFQQITC